MQQPDFSKYPDTEARTPRRAFTARLRTICAKLDAASPQTITNRFRYLGEETSVVEAAGLWVVGSYARGALTCGDLDLVFEVRATSGPRPVRGAAKAFIGAPAGVRVYIGTPTENSSGTQFDEAVLVWKPGLDWEAALTGIPVDPTAARFARVGDQVPLRVEQHLLELPVVEDLVRLREQGVLSWRFVPLSAIPHTLEPRNRWEERTLRLFSEQSVIDLPPSSVPIERRKSGVERLIDLAAG